MKKIIILFSFLLFSATVASAQPGQMNGAQGGHPGPPPEAYTACEGKQVGDSVQITTPRGDTITGTCEQMDGRLVLHPDNMPQGDMAPPSQPDQ